MVDAAPTVPVDLAVRRRARTVAIDFDMMHRALVAVVADGRPDVLSPTRPMGLPLPREAEPSASPA